MGAVLFSVFVEYCVRGYAGDVEAGGSVINLKCRSEESVTGQCVFKSYMYDCVGSYPFNPAAGNGSCRIGCNWEEDRGVAEERMR